MDYLNSNYDFEITDSILDYYNGKDEDVAVPDFVNIISDYTFCDNKHIKNVFILEGKLLLLSMAGSLA